VLATLFCIQKSKIFVMLKPLVVLVSYFALQKRYRTTLCFGRTAPASAVGLSILNVPIWGNLIPKLKIFQKKNIKMEVIKWLNKKRTVNNLPINIYAKNKHLESIH